MEKESGHPFWNHIKESAIHAPLRHRSVYMLNLSKIREAIRSAPDVNGLSDGGETPLHFAVRNRLPTSVVRELLAKNANPNLSLNLSARPSYYPAFCGCLFWAAHHSNNHVAMLLIHHGAVIRDELVCYVPPPLRRKLKEDGQVPLRTVWRHHHAGLLEMTCKSHPVLQILVNRALIEL
jgi:hypothetical protein